MPTITYSNGVLKAKTYTGTPITDVTIIGQTHSSLIKLCKTAYHNYWIEEDIDGIRNATATFEANLDNREQIHIEYYQGMLFIEIRAHQTIKDWTWVWGFIPKAQEHIVWQIKHRTTLRIGGKGWLTEGGPLVTQYYYQQNRLADIREGYLKR